MTVQTLDTIMVIDFNSVCTFVKRFGAGVIDAIHINLEDADFTRDTDIPDEVIDEMIQVFLGKLSKNEIDVSGGDYITFLFDEVVLSDEEEEINQIHAIYDFIKKHKFFVSDIEFVIVLQPTPTQE